MPLDTLGPIFADPRFSAGDGRTKAKARERLFGGYLLSDPEAHARYEQIPEPQQRQVMEEFYRRVEQRWPEAFTLKTEPARVEKRKVGGGRDEFGVRAPEFEVEETVPAKRRTVHDLATEDFIAQVKAGELGPDKLGRAELLTTAPVIAEAAPEKFAAWRERARKVAVEEGVLPEGEAGQEFLSRAIGLMGGVAGPAVAITKGITDATGLRPLEEGALRALTPENRALVALAAPESDAFKTIGTIAALAGGSYGFGTGLTKAGISLLSKRGIALQAAADGALGALYKDEAPGILSSLAGKPDSALLNAAEATAISGIFGVALRAIDRGVSLVQIREAVGFDGDMTAFRDFLKKQGEKLLPPAHSAPNRRPVAATEPAEEGAAVPHVTPEEMQPIALPDIETVKAQLAKIPAEAETGALTARADKLVAKAAAVGEELTESPAAAAVLKEWPAVPELRAALQSDLPPAEIATALEAKLLRPAEPVPVAIKQGESVVGGSVPEQLGVEIGVTAPKPKQMASDDGAAQQSSGSPQSGSKRGTPMRLFRAAEYPEARSGAHFSETRSVAQAYQDNPGFGGPNLYEFNVVAQRPLRLSQRNAHDLSELAEVVGRIRHENPQELQQAWKDSGYRTVFQVLENARGVERDIQSATDWLGFLDDFPENAQTWKYLGDQPLSPNSPRAEGGAPANINQATLPRRISAPLITPDADPVSLASIREYLSKALDIPVRLGVNRVRALGFFRTKAEVIRLKALNDLPTLAHEVGHYLHKIVFPPVRTGSIKAGAPDVYEDFAKQFDGELLQLGQRTSRKSYTQQQVRMEGVAEFVREYLTDRVQALAKAPQFTRFFEQALEQGHPEIWKVVTSAREQLGRYINQSPAMKVRAMIDRKGVKPGLTVRERLEKFYGDWVTELRPIERTMERLVEQGLEPAVAREVSASATNYVGGWRGRVEHDLFKAQTDLQGRVVGEPLRDILRGMKDDALLELGDYMVAKRALELHRRGIKSGIERLDALNTALQYQGKYERTRLKLLGFQHRNLQLLEQSGFFTPQQVAKMRELNRDYVPFYRVYETVGNAGRPGGRGFVNVPGGVRKIKGSDRLIVDPLESIVRNAYFFRDLAERNAIGRKFVNAFEMTGGGGRVADAVVKRVKPVQVPDEEIRRAMLAAGVEEDVVDLMPDLSFTLWKAAKTDDMRQGIFKVWRGGKEAHYQLDDPELLRSLLLMDSADAELVARFPFLRNVLRPLTRIKRAGATLTIEFMSRNPFRDQMQAAIYSKYGFVPLFDGFRGLMSALKKDEWYWDWIKAGGRYSDFLATDRKDLVKALKNVTAEPSVANTIKELADPRNVLLNLQRLSELAEMSTRIGEFRRGIRAGASPMDAANAAKEVSLNFARAGFKGKVWNQIRAFFNASVQDVDKFVRAHKASPGRTAAKGFAYITLPTIGAWWLGKDDPEIQRLPEWRKTLFWNLNVTDVAQAAGIELQAPLVLSFPKPFLLGHVYGTSVERALDYANGRDPNAVKKWFADVFDQLPVNPTMFVPDAGLPLIENATNYSFFRGQPIVSRRFEGVDPAHQAAPNTSQVARLIGESTGTSPLMIDNLVRGYGAGLGRYGTDAIDWFLVKSNLRDAPEPPAKLWRELPGLRAFAGSPYSASNEVDRFYRAMDLAEGRMRTFSYFGKEIGNDAERKWWEKHRNELVYYDQPLRGGDRSIMSELRRRRRDLSEVSAAMLQVQESRTLSAETKRGLLLRLSRQRDTIAAEAVKLLHPEDQKQVR